MKTDTEKNPFNWALVYMLGVFFLLVIPDSWQATLKYPSPTVVGVFYCLLIGRIEYAIWKLRGGKEI